MYQALRVRTMVDFGVQHLPVFLASAGRQSERSCRTTQSATLPLEHDSSQVFTKAAMLHGICELLCRSVSSLIAGPPTVEFVTGIGYPSAANVGMD